MAKSPRKRPAPRTAFVPRAIFQTLFAGVVPAVALSSLAGCGSTTGGADAADAPAQPDVLGVADAGFDAQPRPDSQVIVLAQIGFEVEALPRPGSRVS